MYKFNIDGNISKEYQSKIDATKGMDPNEILEFCKDNFIPFEITENQDDPSKTHRLIGKNDNNLELMYGSLSNDCILTTLTEIWDLGKEGKLFANYGYQYMPKNHAKEFCAGQGIPFEIYVGRLEEAVAYKNKCEVENRPTINIMRMVGARADGLVMYGTETETNGTVSSIMHVEFLTSMIASGQIIDYKDLVS